jgi:putative aminopeptidase FrvX
MIDLEFLKTLTEAPSVGTACGPVIRLLTERFGAGYTRTLVHDGFCLFQPTGATPQDLRVLFVAHMDEVGGCVYGPRNAAEGGGYRARFWGNRPGIFAYSPLQGFDYLAEQAEEAFPIQAELVRGPQDRYLLVDGELIQSPDNRLALHGERIRPYRTGWTFKEATTYDGDTIEGKALDPRVTLYAVVETVRALNDPAVGAMLVMAEECAMDVARKGVAYLQRHAPNLELIANADVPGIHNISEGRLDLPAIRIYEGRNFIDPSFGIHVADVLAEQGVEFHLSAARSGSQTLLFTPLAPTLSIALPSDGVHLPRVKMSLHGTQRCLDLLAAIAHNALSGAFDR